MDKIEFISLMYDNDLVAVDKELSLASVEEKEYLLAGTIEIAVHHDSSMVGILLSHGAKFDAMISTDEMKYLGWTIGGDRSTFTLLEYVCALLSFKLRDGAIAFDADMLTEIIFILLEKWHKFDGLSDVCIGFLIHLANANDSINIRIIEFIAELDLFKHERMLIDYLHSSIIFDNITVFNYLVFDKKVTLDNDVFLAYYAPSLNSAINNNSEKVLKKMIELGELKEIPLYNSDDGQCIAELLYLAEDKENILTILLDNCDWSKFEPIAKKKMISAIFGIDPWPLFKKVCNALDSKHGRELTFNADQKVIAALTQAQCSSLRLQNFINDRYYAPLYADDTRMAKEVPLASVASAVRPA